VDPPHVRVFIVSRLGDASVCHIEEVVLIGEFHIVRVGLIGVCA
jgi:hypothetical protein